jgi:quinol-cytochrome oxidoreductase complex cytochrome b subunit
VIGVLLLILTLAASFSGYLLPWDQLAYWAITVGTSVAGYEPLMGDTIRAVLLGGSEVGQEALTRFYAFHILLVPAAIALLTSIHLWRVRKDGGLAAQDAGNGVEELEKVSNDD